MSNTFGSDLDLALRIRALVEGQDAVVRLGESFVDLNQRVETLVRGLTAISGSQEGAARELEYLNEIANRYGLSLLDLSDNYVKLIASSKGTVLEGEAIKRVFESVSSAMSVLGADTVTTHRAFTALSQIMSKGQVYAEELKGQLAEAIPGALNIMSDALGITTNDLRQLLEAGQLSADVLLPFADELDRRYGKFATTSSTMTQSYNRFLNTWTELVVKIGSTGVWDLLKSRFDALSGSIDKLSALMGVALGASIAKGLVALKNLSVAAYDNARAMLIGASASEKASASNLAAAEASNVLAAQTRNNTGNALLAARANEFAARGTAAHAVALRELSIATASHTIATKQAAVANQALITMQNRLVTTQTALGKAWNFIAGPGGAIALMVAGMAAMYFAFRDQDDVTKILTKSTEEYEKSLVSMSEAEIAISTKKLEANRKQLDEEISLLEKKLDIQRQDAQTSSDRFFNEAEAEEIRQKAAEKSIELTIELEKKRAELFNTEDKLNSSRLSLTDRSSDLFARESALGAKSQELTIAIEQQRKKIELLTQEREKGGSVTRELNDAYRQLSSLKQQAAINDANLSETQSRLNIITTEYAKALKIAHAGDNEAVQGLRVRTSSIQDLSDAIRDSVQRQLELSRLDQQLVASGKLLKSQYDVIDTAIRGVADAKAKEADATGNLNLKRAASIAQAVAEKEAAVQSLAVSENELAVTRNRLAISREKLILDSQHTTQTNKQIGELEALIEKQKAEVEQRRANIAATNAELELRRVESELTSESLARQQESIRNAVNSLSEMSVAYNRALQSGASLSQLESILNDISDKQREVGDLAGLFEVTMNKAARNIGSDWDQLTTGIDFKTKQMVDSMEVLANRGVLTGATLGKSISSAISAADTEQELLLIGNALGRLAESGKISGDQLKLAFGDIWSKMDELRLAVDPLANAMDKLGIGVPERLKSVQEAAQRSFEVIRDGQANVDLTRDAFLKYAEASLKAAEASGKNVDPLLKQIAASLGLSDAYNELRISISKASPEFDAINTAMNRTQQHADSSAKAIESENRAIASGIEVAGKRAEVTGNLSEAIKASVANTYESIRAAEEEVKVNEINLKIIDDRIKKLEEEKRLYGLSAEQEERLSFLRDERESLANTTTESRNKDEALKAEAFSQRQVIAEQQRLGEIAKQEEDLNDSVLQSRKKRVEAEKNLAVVIGDTRTASEKNIEILKIDAEIAANNAKGKRDAAIAASEYASSLRDAALADGLLTQEEEAGIASANKNAESMRQEADAADKVSESAKKASEAAAENSDANKEQAHSYTIMEDAAVGALRELSGLSDGMNKLVGEMRGVQDNAEGFGLNFRGELGKLRLQMEWVNQAMEHNSSIIGTNADAFEENANIANKARKIYLEQAIAATELAGRLKDMGESTGISTVKMTDLIRQGQTAIQGMTLLDQTTLDNLKNEIDGAKSKLLDMQDAADTARRKLKEMDADLLEAKGQTKRADLLREDVSYQEKLSDLESQRRDAEEAGNTELLKILDQQLEKLNQLHQIKLDNIESDKNSKSSTSDAANNMTKLADEAERANKAVAGLSGLTLGNLVTESTTLHKNLNSLNELL